KTKIDKLISASDELSSTESVSIVDNKIIWVDLYKLKSSPDDMVTFSLLFYNTGVITTSNVYLNKQVFGGLENIHGSILDYPIDTNSNLMNKTFDIYLAATATELTTPLPADFKVSLILKGGKGTIAYPILDRVELNTIGQTIEVNYSIFMY
ncbi:hypothetical protein, partial [Flavobacterium sp.]